MNIQLLSDLHLEYHRDYGVGFIASLDPTGVDVLVLAGDISIVQRGRLQAVLELFCDKYPQVVLVAGNHEYFNGSVGDTQAALCALDANLPNLHWLENRTCTIGGQRFVGTTMWFPDLPDGLNKYYSQGMPDFHAIDGFKPWVYKQNKAATAFLTATVQPGDVVVTHHIPCIEGVHPRWLPDHHGFGRFFINQMPQDTLRTPALWFYGHTHDSMAFQLGGCRFFCNPLARAHEPNMAFNDKLIVDPAQ